LEEDFLTWKKALWQPLCELFNLEIVEDEEESFEVYAFFLNYACPLISTLQ